jgi:hypothetical protein
MSTDFDQVLHELEDRRRVAAKRYAEDPLPATPNEARLRLRAEIDKYGLAEQVVDLEINGYTILPPGRAASVEFTELLRDAILRVADGRSARNVREPDSLRAMLKAGTGRPLFHLLPEDPIFQEAVMNPTVLTLVTYLAGYRARLTTATGLIKTNETDAALYWHTDNGYRLPLPWPRQSMSANVNWMLTKYTRENGALCVVPGSHAWCQQPDHDFPFDHELVEVIEVPAGSIAVWHSNLWHAALPRKSEGKRVTFVTLYSRPFFDDTEPNLFTTTQEMIENNPPRFTAITGLVMMGLSGIEGPDPSLTPAMTRDQGRWT